MGEYQLLIIHSQTFRDSFVFWQMQMLSLANASLFQMLSPYEAISLKINCGSPGLDLCLAEFYTNFSQRFTKVHSIVDNS